MAELLDDHVFDLSARAGVRSLQPLGQLLGPHGDSQVTNSLSQLLGRCQLLHACLAFKQGANTSTAQARVANLESKLVRLLVDLAGTNLDAQDVERAAATVNDELAEAGKPWRPSNADQLLVSFNGNGGSSSSESKRRS